VCSVFVLARCNPYDEPRSCTLEFHMTTRFIKAATLLACAVFSTFALAEPPARVGRVSLSQGQVGISSEAGDQASAAQVNWPVTSHNVVTTGRGGRTEIRIGSTSIRLDGDSSLEVSELDDDSLRLRLNYGSVNLRIPTAEALAGFELSTSNGRVLLREPGRLRVDAGRVEGTSVVNVFDGVAVVEDRGTQLVVRAGRRAEIRDDDVLTGQATRDSFDDWSQQRDQYDDRSTSARYVTSEMTGYEDLDRNGTWRDDPEYGPLWLPTTVAAGWAPYRDGSWTWIAPWGWTWVDNAPWGYGSMCCRRPSRPAPAAVVRRKAGIRSPRATPLCRATACRNSTCSTSTAMRGRIGARMGAGAKAAAAMAATTATTVIAKA
jgi:hypothetical protein